MLQSNPTRGGSKTMKTIHAPFWTANQESVFHMVTQILESSQQYQSYHCPLSRKMRQERSPIQSTILVWKYKIDFLDGDSWFFSQIVTDCGEVIQLVLTEAKPQWFRWVLCLGKDLALSSSGMGDVFSLQLFLFRDGGRGTQVQNLWLYWSVEMHK